MVFRCLGIYSDSVYLLIYLVNIKFYCFILNICSRNMGGKLGLEVRSNLHVEKMSDLAKYSMSELQGRFGDKTG